MGDAIEEEDRVVYLLASLPDSFNTLVTALEASEEVPKMEIVTERLLHAERKHKGKACPDSSGERAMTTKRQFKGKCHYCKKYGHMQKNCAERIKAEGKTKPGGASETERGKKRGKVELLTCHVLGVRKPAETWIVDSGGGARFGHLGERSLCSLKKDQLVDGFDYDASKEINFCESCVNGKIHRRSFPKGGHGRATEPLGLVHSDVCGKISPPSLSQAEYFVVFMDDKTHYVWIYILQHKHEVFQKFVEWKSFVEKSLLLFTHTR